MPFEKSCWFDDDEPVSVPSPSVLQSGPDLIPAQHKQSLYELHPHHEEKLLKPQEKLA